MKNRKGFTLIELMIVIAIIGILAAMAVPNFRRARASARQKACMSNCRVVMGAIEMYNMDHNSDYSSGSVPDEPSGEAAGYWKKINKPDSECSYYYNKGNSTVYCGIHGCPGEEKGANR